jgi:hypothetical protein
MNIRSGAIFIWSLIVISPVVPAQEAVDLSVVHKIKQEAFKNSQVMDHLFYMTEINGPRLTNSPGLEKSARWVARTADEWGLANVDLETWGGAGRGWSVSHYEAHLREPGYLALIGVPLAWTPGTDGVISGVPVLAARKPTEFWDLDAYEKSLDEYMATWKGKLSGKMVLLEEAVNILPITEAPAKRLSAEELGELAKHPTLTEPIEIDLDNIQIPRAEHLRARYFSQLPWTAMEILFNRILELNSTLQRFLADEGVVLAIYPGNYNDGGTIFPPLDRSHKADAGAAPPSIVLTPEHYNRLVRLAERELMPRIEVEVAASFHEDDTDGINIVAEIPGGKKRDELVLIGAHFDDVVYGTGATDNAAGSAVMLEVMRILKTLDLKLDRTVRMVLWSGEEQGLLGSQAYVAKHFGDWETMKLKPDHSKVSAYYNLDNGTGKIRGVYLQNNDMVRGLFSQWLAPFSDLGASTVTIRNTGGTDHLAFDAVGLPGFQFIQDSIEYDSRTHHSNMDVYDRAQAGDLMQAAAIIASFVYHTANRKDLLPRKPLPEPKE